MSRTFEQREIHRTGQGHAEYEEDVDLSDVLRKAAELGLNGVVLLGEPGSGKTTGSRQLSWRLTSRQCLAEDVGLPAGMIPVFLRFRNLSRSTWKRKNGLRAFLEQETHCDDAPGGLENPGAELWNGEGAGPGIPEYRTWA